MIRERLRNWILTEEEQELVERVETLEEKEHPFDTALQQAEATERFDGDAEIVVLYGVNSQIGADLEDGQLTGVVATNNSVAYLK